MTKELGVTIGNSDNSTTYEIINTNNENGIIVKHTSSLINYRLCVNEENKCLISTSYQTYYNSNIDLFPQTIF